MKWILSGFILFYSGFAQASGRIPFLFAVRVAAPPAGPPAGLNWNVTYMQFDGFTGGFSQTVTLTNTQGAISNVIVVSMTSNGTSFQIQNDTCTGGFLLDGGSCTVDIFFNGFATPDEQLTATDSIFTTPAMTIHNCPAC